MTTPQLSEGNISLVPSGSAAGKELPLETSANDKDKGFVLICRGEAAAGKQPLIRLRGREREVCWRSLLIFPLSGCLRQQALLLVSWRWFDRFILCLIALNSVMLASYQYRASPDEGWNWVVDNVLDRTLTVLFTFEFLFKVIAWGFFWDKGSYLREVWNWLDFIVVITALISFFPMMENTGLGFLRLFRILRPLRSLKQVPQMKVLVDTIISSIPRLANVSIMMFFFFWIFGIVGINILDGIFYHACRSTAAPVFRPLTNSSLPCWEWAYTGDERLCGGRYMCQDPPEGVDKGFCGGREDDPNKDVRPAFEGGRRGYEWCPGSEPMKTFPETDFIHFDHMGGALLTVFQCMTMEGWTDIMYYVQDGFGFWVATIYFFLLIPITSFFLLNLALAVVDEAREDFDKVSDEPADDESSMEDGNKSPTSDAALMENIIELDGQTKDLWIDCCFVRVMDKIAMNEVFTNFVMFFIAGNVVTMMLEQFPPHVSWQDFLEICELVFLTIFCIEMFIMIGAMGPKSYVKNPVTCFDGFIVVISVVQVAMGGDGGSAFTALRTLRLFRVLNKLANRWPSFRVLLKAMVQTGISLFYWLVLFFLFLYIWTLMWMDFFNRQFHFKDEDAGEVSESQGQPWCAGSEEVTDPAYKQDCIPRANFDTFLWSWVTIFQIMTGENWNTIMYAGMRSIHWFYAGFFIALIVFGQILFLSLFLSMLMAKFGEVKEALDEQEQSKNSSRRASLQAKTLEKTSKSGSFYETVVTVKSLKRTKVSPEEAIADGGGENAKLPGTCDGSAPVAGSSAYQVVNEEERAKGSDAGPANQVRDDDLELPPDSQRGMNPQVPNESPKQTAPSLDDKGLGKKPTLGWPHGYALLVLHETNPIRRACWWVLTKQVSICSGENINGFDNFILLCILTSTLCMALDYPLRNPSDPFTKALRTADVVFAVIFIVEMVIKLLAMGLVFGKNAYLKSPWNWLDGVVVCVSVMGMASSSTGGFLKTLRIMRALRPLRVISRNANLKIVVQTIFASVPALATLVMVCMVFLLIFALFALSYLNGTFYSCEVGATAVAFATELGALATTPLCLSPTISASSVHSACPHGRFNGDKWLQESSECPSSDGNCEHNDTSLTLPWQRATVDTPICVGRCSVTDNDGVPSWLCPRRYETQAELPSNCQDPGVGLSPELLASQQIGEAYRSAMVRALVMPCGGSMVNGSTGAFIGGKASPVSCRAAFCPSGVSDDKVKSCASNCRKHPFFCKETCKSKDYQAPSCRSCLTECEAVCQCEDFCEPLIKDAALCFEQGGTWRRALDQNFDNIWNSLLTLFEISSTEGWVDVMYAAVDSRQPYEEPKRENQQWLFAPFFVVYIFTSFMFLLNLSVGVIVDNFMSLKATGVQVLLTETQEKWLKSKQVLFAKSPLFFMIRNLHELSPCRRRVYNLVSSAIFEQIMTGVIVGNTVVMAAKVYPYPTDWWEDLLQGLDYPFTVIFVAEFIMKYYALRRNYWLDSWNCFDFTCVLAAIIGVFLSIVAPSFEVGQSLAKLFRIFRIARLFRLLRSARLNKIFMALIMSLPKLANVLMILLLLLTLYSILGVSLFSTVHHSSTLNMHGNFMNFGWAFITLFRAVTGEAWNNIMHDLLKTEKDFFREGSWCTPDHLFDTATSEKFDLLQKKCLIHQPNSCVQTFWGWNPMPAIFWITYILLICLMVMNLVIAVILEGYEDGKKSAEAEVIELCIETWEKYDPDHRMMLPLSQALVFYNEVTYKWNAEHAERATLFKPGCGSDIATGAFNVDGIQMRHMNNVRMTVASDGCVHWIDACKQVLRFSCAEDNEEYYQQLEEAEKEYSNKRLKRLGSMEEQKLKQFGVPSQEEGVDLRTMVAVTKLQRFFRKRVERKLQVGKGSLCSSPEAHAPGRPSSPEAMDSQKAHGVPDADAVC